VYEGIHSKTGARYLVRMTEIVGEVSPSPLTEILEALVIESKDPTLQ
jgi:hypothetical protein